jgi:hypothetical protein
MDERHVPVILHSVPGDAEKLPASGYIADTPENRRLLEDAAIPKCREWREANPEFIWAGDVTDESGIVVRPENLHRKEVPAPYCCSAYCDRCAGLRALDGEPPLPPNDWMNP